FPRLPEAFVPPAEGFPVEPEGVLRRAEGFPRLPEALLPLPEGFPLEPEGVLRRAEGFPRLPEAFLPPPEGIPPRPESSPLSKYCTTTPREASPGPTSAVPPALRPGGADQGQDGEDRAPDVRRPGGGLHPGGRGRRPGGRAAGRVIRSRRRARAEAGLRSFAVVPGLGARYDPGERVIRRLLIALQLALGAPLLLLLLLLLARQLPLPFLERAAASVCHMGRHGISPPL